MNNFSLQPDLFPPTDSSDFVDCGPKEATGYYCGHFRNSTKCSVC